MITEQHLIDYGFTKEVVLMDESGMDYDFYYYSYTIGNLDFLSCESDMAEKYNGQWTVQILEGDIELTDWNDLKKVLDILKIYEL